MNAALTKTYPEPPFCEREILRYACCKGPDEGIAALLRLCVEEARGRLAYRVCFRELPVTSAEEACDFGLFCLQSKNLARNLQGCKTTKWPL